LVPSNFEYTLELLQLSLKMFRLIKSTSIHTFQWKNQSIIEVHDFIFCTARSRKS